MLNTRTLIMMILFSWGISMSISNAWSQPKAQNKVSKKTQSKKTVKKETKKSQSDSSASSADEGDLSQTTPGKVIEFSQFTIEGTIPRPSAAYLLQRRKLKFRGLTPKKSFLPALFKSVERSPF